jgi:cyclopropane fatty-acyl-phospholipid synthase-like methyltransferase
MRTLDACPVCATQAHTPVLEFNRFILHEEIPAGEQIRSDYALCHGCGLLYSGRRPSGGEYVDLLVNFNESLGRAVAETNVVLFPGELTPEQREDIRRRAQAGALVSEDTPLGPQDHLDLLGDRLSTAPHVELLASLADVRGARVLEIRSKTGALLDALRKWHDADVMAMPIFPSQKAVIEDVYGIPTSGLIDFEHFDIPFEGTFDVIVSKHMFTHALNPLEFLRTVRSRLSPGGRLYLYAEPDDRTAMDRRKSIFATMNPFHQQAFDVDVLKRCLRVAGFDMTFIAHESSNLACLAVAGEPRLEPISEPVLRRRIEDHARWHEYSVLNLPKASRHLYAAEWDAIERSALQHGVAERDERGRVRLSKPKKQAA